MYVMKGSDEPKINGQVIWQVWSDDDVLICNFYGPMSFMCAAAACKAMNEGWQMPQAMDVFNKGFE